MKTVMIFGTFDIVHHGHLHLFKQAKKYGDHSIAVVGRDARVQSIKGKQTVHTEKERKAFLEQIRLIDEVVLGDKNDVYKIIKKMKPDVIILGYDQNHFTDQLAGKIKEFGLKTKVIRAKPYKKQNLKTRKIRKILETKI